MFPLEKLARIRRQARRLAATGDDPVAELLDQLAQVVEQELLGQQEPCSPASRMAMLEQE